MSFSRVGDHVQWIQLLQALDQQGNKLPKGSKSFDGTDDYPGWPLSLPPKVQMQKCEKCSQEFCSAINYRRHSRVHRRTFPGEKDSSKDREYLGAFWDKLSLEEAKEILSFKNVALEELSGSAIIKALTTLIRKPGLSPLPHNYVKAGGVLLDLIQAKPTKLPMSSNELFSLLDDASETTFLCPSTSVTMQKFIFDGDVSKIGLEMRNLIACTSFCIEQKLMNAWVADKDAEALRCQKLLVEEEEAAHKKQDDLLEKKRLKRQRQKEQKEQKVKEQVVDDTIDVKEASQSSMDGSESLAESPASAIPMEVSTCMDFPGDPVIPEPVQPSSRSTCESEAKNEVQVPTHVDMRWSDSPVSSSDRDSIIEPQTSNLSSKRRNRNRGLRSKPSKGSQSGFSSAPSGVPKQEQAVDQTIDVKEASQKSTGTSESLAESPSTVLKEVSTCVDFPSDPLISGPVQPSSRNTCENEAKSEVQVPTHVDMRCSDSAGSSGDCDSIIGAKMSNLSLRARNANRGLSSKPSKGSHSGSSSAPSGVPKQATGPRNVVSKDQRPTVVSKDQRPTGSASSHMVWSKKVKAEECAEGGRSGAEPEQPDQSTTYKLMIGSVPVPIVRSGGMGRSCAETAAVSDTADRQIGVDTVTSCATEDADPSTVAESTARDVSGSAEIVNLEPEIKNSLGEAEAQASDSNKGWGPLSNLEVEAAKESSLPIIHNHDIETFMHERWKKALSEDHVRLVYEDVESSCSEGAGGTFIERIVLSIAETSVSGNDQSDVHP